MSPRLKLLQRVRDVRARLRDVAAAAESAAEARREEARREEDRAWRSFHETLEAGSSRLGEGASRADLQRFDDERRAIREWGTAAQRARAVAARASEEASALRQTFEAKLRASERLLEGCRASIDRRNRRDEQRLTDDLAAWRTRRR